MFVKSLIKMYNIITRYEIPNILITLTILDI